MPAPRFNPGSTASPALRGAAERDGRSRTRCSREKRGNRWTTSPDESRRSAWSSPPHHAVLSRGKSERWPAAGWGAANLESEIRKMYEVGGRRFRVALLATEVTASRRSYAKLCHSAGGELEQIQFLLGHVSVQTTERYLGCKQRISGAVNDRIGIEP